MGITTWQGSFLINAVALLRPEPAVEAVAPDILTPVQECYALGKNHPLANAIGAFANDPGWDDMMEEIRKLRQAIDEAPSR